LPSGLLFTLAYFVAVQAAVLVYAAATGARVVNDWAAVGAGTAAYLLAAQLLGNALYEEVVFRGFLLPQLFLELRGAGTALALVLAPVVSQALFAVAHVPNRLWVTGLAPGELPGALLPLFLMGLFFALLYLLTVNLFAVVGVHALNNAQMLSLLVAGGRLAGANAVIVAVLALALAVGGRLWRVRAGGRARGGWPSPGASAARSHGPRTCDRRRARRAGRPPRQASWRSPRPWAPAGGASRRGSGGRSARTRCAAPRRDGRGAARGSGPPRAPASRPAPCRARTGTAP